MTFHIRVRPDFPWTTARVSGRIFHRADATVLHESEMNDEIRTSALLVIAEEAAAPVIEPSVEKETGKGETPEPPTTPAPPDVPLSTDSTEAPAFDNKPAAAAKPAARKPGGK